jgi:hypothetical protein
MNLGIARIAWRRKPESLDRVQSTVVEPAALEPALVAGSWRPASVAEVRVGLLRSHPKQREYERHEQGRDVFLFRGLTPGHYTLLAWRVRRERLDLHQEEVEVKAATEHTLRLQPRWRDLGDVGLRGRSLGGGALNSLVQLGSGLRPRHLAQPLFPRHSSLVAQLPARLGVAHRDLPAREEQLQAGDGRAPR